MANETWTKIKKAYWMEKNIPVNIYISNQIKNLYPGIYLQKINNQKSKTSVRIGSENEQVLLWGK